MSIAILSYSKFESIQLQREGSAVKSNERRKMLSILYVMIALALPLLTDCLESVLSIKRM